MSYFRENIERLHGYLPGFQPDSSEVVKLNTNENPYPPSPQVLDAVRNIAAESLRRYPPPLGDSFRNAAANVHNVSPENIMCTNGGDDLLTICFRAFCNGDRSVAYPGPTYSLYPVLAELQGCSAVEVEFDDEDMPGSLADTSAALTIVCNPNAPTGSFMPIQKIAELAGMVAGVLLIDEAYVDFAKDNCIELVTRFKNVIILRSMSKGYSLAGIRFGYCIASEEIIEGLRKVKDSYNVDAVAIAAATAAIKDQQYFKENVEKIISERARLTDALRQLDFTVRDSQTNFLLARCADSSAGQVYKKLIERNIFVRYFDIPDMRDKLRITVGTPEQNDKLINALKEILSQ